MAVGNVEWGHFGRQEKTQRAAAERESWLELGGDTESLDLEQLLDPIES